MIPERDKEFLKTKFAEEMINPVTIVFFTDNTDELSCRFCDETEQLIHELASLSDKITVEPHSYSPYDALAKELGIDKIPALILKSGAIKGVRFYGIPGGFEFGPLVDCLVDISRNSTQMPAEVRERIKSIAQGVHIQVFVTPTCPYCPSAARPAHQMAIENPDHIIADVVEVAEFPELIERYEITAVPTVIINDKVQFEGVIPETEFVEQVARAA